MNNLRKFLAAVSMISVTGAPLLAASGVGILAAAALGAAGGVAGAVLLFIDSPKSASDAAKLGTTVKGAIETVKVAQVMRKGQSGT